MLLLALNLWLTWKIRAKGAGGSTVIPWVVYGVLLLLGYVGLSTGGATVVDVILNLGLTAILTIILRSTPSQAPAISAPTSRPITAAPSTPTSEPGWDFSAEELVESSFRRR
jgi:hypothetical protein